MAARLPVHVPRSLDALSSSVHALEACKAKWSRLYARAQPDGSQGLVA
jgi:hypothetical protein